MDGNELFDELRTRVMKRKGAGSITDTALAKELGITPGNLSQSRANTMLSARQIVNLIDKFEKRAQGAALTQVVKPIVEFFEIDRTKSRHGATWEIFSPKDVAENSAFSHLLGIKRALSEAQGIYIFYDSRGRAIYVGKTTGQNLWKEIKLAFNRDRGAVQSIKKVKHPGPEANFELSSDSVRSIKKIQVALHELSTYFSAYEVADSLIGILEALLVRAFANDLLNVKMESLASGY